MNFRNGNNYVIKRHAAASHLSEISPRQLASIQSGHARSKTLRKESMITFKYSQMCHNFQLNVSLNSNAQTAGSDSIKLSPRSEGSF